MSRKKLFDLKSCNILFDAISVLDVHARSKIRTTKWTLKISYWNDNTFSLEYRHSSKKGIHRFFYQPHIDCYLITYKLMSTEQIVETQEAKLDFSGECLEEEFIRIGNQKK